MGAKKANTKKGNEGNLGEIWAEFDKYYKAAIQQNGMQGENKHLISPTIDTKIANAKADTKEIVLYVGEENLYTVYMKILFESLVKSNFYEVQAIRLWKCTIDDLAINKMCHYIKEVKMGNLKTNKLIELELLDCKLSSKGCEYIGDALEFKGEHGEGEKQVSYLRLDSNNFGDQGFRKLNKGLRQNAILNTLSMNHCGLTQDCSRSLMELLIFKDSKIKELNLEGNDLRAKGAMTIFKAMQLNGSLQSLNLSDNKIEESDEFVEKFIQFIKLTSNPVEYLFIQKNNIGMKTCNELYRALSAMPDHQFQQIYLPDKIDKDLSGRIGEFMNKKNKKKGKKKK